jgi:hypothetical protein
VRALEKNSDAVFAAVVAKLRTMLCFAVLTDGELAMVVNKMTRMLQTADLTINFNPLPWFAQPNHYKTYTQMYERGRRVGTDSKGRKEVRIIGNALNPATGRDAIDTKVSFGPNITDKAMQGVARFMQTGGKAAKDNPTDMIVTNKTFNEKAQPIFAALNYGRRSEGSTNEYGHAHLVLEDHFKHNAIYYMGDTFDSGATHASRTTYGTLLSLILYAKPKALEAIVQSCFRNCVLDNTTSHDTLVEAHIYDVIPFRGGVRKLVVSRWGLMTSVNAVMFKDDYDPATSPNVDSVTKNMKDFCERNKIKLVILD